MYRILMIDDEPDLLIPHKVFLEKNDCCVDTVDCAGDAAALLAQHRYDLILLDVKMPDICGFDLCGKLAHLTDAPMVFLSSLTDDADQLQGFSAGAADYIPKDCSLELFWARLQTRLSPVGRAEAIRSFPPLTLNLQRQTASVDGVDLRLTQTEFLLLALLSSRPNTIWTVEMLYREIWGENSSVNGTLVQMHLSRMRCKIEEAFPRHEFVETVWRKGYQFVPVSS